jgi:Zn-dependent oligopeptidase
MKKELKITPKRQNTEGSLQAETFANNILTNLRSTENKGDKKRINFDMPAYLFEMMMEKADKKGDSMRNYFVNLVRKDLGED